MKNEALAALAELVAAGIRPTVWQSKHIHIAWTHGGQLRKTIVPRSSSDVRSIRNQRAWVRRVLRADGLLRREGK